jgi:phage terminase large subunit-like protein
MQLAEQSYSPAMDAIQANPFAGGVFAEGQLRFPVSPDMVEFKGLPDPDEIIDLYNYLDPAEQRELDRLLGLNEAAYRVPLLHQIIPWWRDDWEIMALNGGRGVGKTDCGAAGTLEHLEAVGSKARVGIGAPTNSDVRDVCLEGETGLITLYGHRFKYYNRSMGEARHVKGGYVKAMGTEKPKRWNGPQWSFLWFDEFSLCNRKAVDDAFLGLRLGPKEGPYRARALVTMTPKGQRWVEDLLNKPEVYVPHYIGPDGKPRFPTTFDNPHLPQRRVELLKNQFMHTRLGLQELLGQFIGDTAGAMWNRHIIRHETDEAKWPRFTRIVVAVDPAGSVSRKKADENAQTDEDRANFRKNADTAICVKAKGTDGRIYTLAWLAGQWTPNEWATKVVEWFRLFRADRIVAEKNFGGLMVESTIRNVWRDAPITLVTASRGKHVRAEPVVALYEQGREVHCMIFAEAEHQLCAFVDGDENEGADYVDSGVWATWELMGWNEMDFGARIYGVQTELTGLAVY